MRRFVALVLLCLFSLQASWAVAAAYCQHESSPDAAHFGHHVHDHATDTAQLEPSDESVGASAADLDCHACHACTACLTPDVTGVALAPNDASPSGQHDPTLPAPPHEPLDRPDWQVLA